MEKKIDINELKAIQTDILRIVHNYCESNGLLYFLSYGSLIGAVRHGGYIPWDDDIDICLLRKDYDKIVVEYNKVCPSNTRICSIETDDAYFLPYAKIEDTRTVLKEYVDNPMTIGVNIDLFPLDAVPSDERKRKILFSRMSFYRRIMDLKLVKVDFQRRGIVKNVALFLAKSLLFFVSPRSIAVHMVKLIDKEDNESEYICDLVAGTGINSCFHRISTREQVDIKFEDVVVKTMAGYDEYLTKTYGSYMTMPPEKDRVSHHVFKAWWK